MGNKLAKVAYLMKQEVDLKTVVPPDFEYLKVSADPNGTWERNVLAQLHDVEALIVWSEPVTKEVIAAAPNLKIVQRLGA